MHGLVEHGQFQCRHSILKDLELPKFNDSTKQNTVRFLSEKAAIFLLERISESVKVPIALKAMTDSYTTQWLTARCEDLGGYSDFVKAAAELLWSAKIQLQVYCQVYQEYFIKQGRKICQHTLCKVRCYQHTRRLN